MMIFGKKRDEKKIDEKRIEDVLEEELADWARDDFETEEEVFNDWGAGRKTGIEDDDGVRDTPTVEYGYELDPATGKWVRKETRKAVVPSSVRQYGERVGGIQRGEAFKGGCGRPHEGYERGASCGYKDPYRYDPYGERDYGGPKYGGWKGKPEKRDWWFDDYGFRADRVDLGEYSLTQKTRDAFFGWYSYDDRDVMGKCKRILGQLDRSANTIGNGQLGVFGEEKQFEVRYTDGKSENDVKSPVIYVNPDPLIEASGTDLDKATDGLTGHVLIGAQIKLNAHERSFREARRSAGGDEIENLSYEIWKALEGSIARKNIVTRWPGYSTYLVRHSETMRKDKDSVESLVKGEKPNPKAAALGIAWNLFHDCDRVEMPDHYREGVELAAKALDKPIKPEKRLHVCRRIVKGLYQLYVSEEEPECPMCQKPQPGDKKQKSKDPQIIDDSLFGGKVETKEGKHSEALAALVAEKEGHKRDLNDEVPRYWNGSVEVKPHYVVRPVTDSNPMAYAKKVRELSKQITYVKQMLMFRNTKRAQHEYGLVSGELDEDALHKVSYDSQHIWRKSAYVSERDIGMVVLLDESGSMSSDYNWEQARDVGITLYEGLKDVSGIKMGIIGHTAQEGSHGSGEVDIREYVVPGKERPSNLMSFSARSNNLDGYAIMYAGRKLYEWFSSSTMKILFVVSDGHPNGYGYGGTPAYRHTGECVEKARSLYGCEIYGIGVNNAYDDRIGEMLYGKGYYTVLGDVKQSMYILTRFMRQVAMRV